MRIISQHHVDEKTRIITGLDRLPVVAVEAIGEGSARSCRPKT